MTIELAPEVEKAILAEAEATGLTPVEIANRHLASALPAQGAPMEMSIEDFLATLPPDPEAEERAQAMIEKMRALRERVNPSWGPPPGVRFRDWIHEDHRF